MLRGYSWRKVIDKPEKFFVLTASLFGILLVFLTPPLQGPDEQAHFAQVYRYSEGKASPVSDLPKGLVGMYKTVFYEDDIRFMSNEKYELGRTKHALLKVPLEQSVRVDGIPYGGTVYSPIVYLPQIATVALGRLLDFPAIVLLYLARLASLAAFVSLMYLAIRFIPFAKWPIAIVGLLPMSVFSASMVSSDAITTGASALFIAFVLSVFVSKNSLNRGRTILLAAVTILVSMTKLVSVVLLPLLLLLVFKKYKNTNRTRNILITISIMLCGVVAAFIWQAIAPATSDGVNSSIPQHVIPAEQIKLMIQAPQKFLFALWNTYFYTWGDSIYYSLIGTLGWVDTPMSIFFVLLGYTMLTLTFLANREEDSRILGKLSKKSRIILIGVTALYIGAVNAAMFIFYTPVDYNIIVGLQGRYFIPGLFLLAILLINQNQIQIKQRLYRVLITAIPVLLLIVSSVYVFIRYYIETKI